jgi:flavodoxin
MVKIRGVPAKPRFLKIRREATMKAIVVYDSRFGHTQKIAEAIGEGLEKVYESEVFSVRDAGDMDVTEDADLLVVGSPTQGGTYTESIKAFLAGFSEDSLEGMCAVSFDTSTLADNHGFVVSALTRLLGNAAPKISAELKKKGARCIDSEIFYVVGKKGPLIRGETERARHWAEKLIKKASRNKPTNPSRPTT